MLTFWTSAKYECNKNEHGIKTVEICQIRLVRFGL